MCWFHSEIPHVAGPGSMLTALLSLYSALFRALLPCDLCSHNQSPHWCNAVIQQHVVIQSTGKSRKAPFWQKFPCKLIWKGCREEGVFRNSSWEEPWNLFIFRISPIKPLMVKSFIPLQSISRWLFNSYAKANQIILTIKDKINTFCNLSSRRSLTCTISI